MKSGTLETSSSFLFEPYNERGSPERLLLLAILERAILDFVGNDVREMEQATAWMFGGDDELSAEPFSFQWVCKELDLDSARVSAMIKAMPKRGTNRVAPWYFQKDGQVQKHDDNLVAGNLGHANSEHKDLKGGGKKEGSLAAGILPN